MREEEENDTGVDSDRKFSKKIKRLILNAFSPSPLIREVRDAANTPSSNQEDDKYYLTAFQNNKP